MASTAEKLLLRQEMLNKRKSLPASAITAGSQAICRSLVSFPHFMQAKTVMGYLAMPGEPQLDEFLLYALDVGKTVCVPFMGPVFGVMEAVEITSLNGLISGRLGVRMPDPSTKRIVSASCIDLVLTPGVAFDKNGRRLGMGAGYYDRFLASAPQACRVGIAWSLQLVDQVPHAEHDILMQWLVTENSAICCGEQRHI